MTGETIISTVRDLVNDNSETQTWDDRLYYACLTDGLRIIFNRCPDSRLTNGGFTISAWAAADSNTPQATLCVDDVYMPALIEYVMFRYYDRDSGDTRDKTQAQSHRQAFVQLLSPKV